MINNIKHMHTLPDFSFLELKQAAGLFLIVWFYTKQTWLLKPVDRQLDKWASKSSPLLERIIREFQNAIDCHKCLSFWTILILLQNPLLALGFAWIASKSK
jgi:hypothetical protein